jgi:hypothetical protein
LILPALLLVTGARAQEIPICGYYGQYDAGQKAVGFPSKSLSAPRRQTWIPAKPRKDYHIGVLLPHLKDSYWVAADYGIVTRARELGLHLTLFTAGAYINFGNQQSNRKLHPNAKIVATYITPTVYEQIQKRLIQAAPSDQIISQCTIAVDMVVKILNGSKPGVDFPFRASPNIPLITPRNIDLYAYKDLFGERGFVTVCNQFE